LLIHQQLKKFAYRRYFKKFRADPINKIFDQFSALSTANTIGNQKEADFRKANKRILVFIADPSDVGRCSPQEIRLFAKRGVHLCPLAIVFGIHEINKLSDDYNLLKSNIASFIHKKMDKGLLASLLGCSISLLFQHFIDHNP